MGRMRVGEWQVKSGRVAGGGALAARVAALATLVVSLLALWVAAPASALQPKKGHARPFVAPSWATWAQSRHVHYLPWVEHQGHSLGTSLPLTSRAPREGLEACENCGQGGAPLRYYPERLGVQHEPQILAIFWGSKWNEEPGFAVRAQVMKMYSGLSGSAYQGILTQYFDATGRINSFVSDESYTDWEHNPPADITEHNIDEEAGRAIAANGWSHSLNFQFVVFTPPGSTYSFTGYCAYHEYNVVDASNEKVVVAWVPYEGDAPLNEHCLSHAPAKNVGDATSGSASHEYAESATDPGAGEKYGTWRSTEDEHELADMCDELNSVELPNGSFVAHLWDDHQSACSTSDAEPPHVTAIAEPAVGITTTGATLNGIVNPEGLETKYHFEYGRTTSYGTGTSEVTLSASTSNVSVSKTITGLAGSDVLYHYRLVATNSTGTTDSMDRTFTTPTVETTAVGGVIAHEATVDGLINPIGEETTYHFEYGETTSYGTDVPIPDVNIGSGKNNIAVSQSLLGLKHLKTYHVRLVATNSSGTMNGNDVTFRTGRGGTWLLGGLPPTEPAPTSWKGKLKLSESEAGAVVECEETAEGTVAQGDGGEITKWTMSKCADLKVCESGSTLEAVHLPWKAELAEIKGVMREELAGSGHGEPGYTIKCKLLGTTSNLECIAPALSASTTNGVGGVTATFLSGEKLNCNGKVGKGTLEGVQTIEATKGGQLSALPEVEWRLGGVVLTEGVAASGKGKIKLTDPFLGEKGVNGGAECEDTVEGSVASGDTGEITKITMSKCGALAPCESSSSASLEARDLPWHTELVTTEGVTHDVLAGTGHGEPEVRMKCKFLGLLLTDECKAPTFSTSATNGVGGVTATFLAGDKLSCNGRASEGILEGSQTIEATRGGKLSAVNATEAAKLSEAEWRLGGVALTESQATSWKGKLKLGESETGEAVECEDTAEGSAVPTDVGEVTKWTSSKCVSLKICESSGITVEAVHLPWHAEVITIEGATHYVLTSGGHGEPGYKMGCKVLGVAVTSECTASTLSTSTTNGSSGLTATFLASEKLTCNGAARVGTLEGTQTITASKGGKLEAT